MNHRDVVDSWHEQDRDYANGHNVYYKGKTIYSYGSHFPMAYRTDYMFKGKDIILYNSTSYSVSTSKHQSYVRTATGYDFIFELSTELISDVIYQLEHYHGINERLRSDLKDYFQKHIEFFLLKAKRARKDWYKSYNIKRASSLLDQLEALHELPEYVHVPSEADSIPL